ncbi:SCAN domain-containing protein 3, partial [Trichinella zimbabwensis]
LILSLVAQKKKPHRIAEELILPCTKEMVLSVLDEDATRKISDISVSNNTIRRSIADSFTDLRSQSVEEMMDVHYSQFNLMKRQMYL